MKIILWAQNEDAMIKDTFVIDGVVSQASGTKEEAQAFSKLTQASNYLILTPKNRKKLSDSKGFSEQANFSIENGTYYIQGCFLEKDNVGRDMPYMFLISDCASFEEAIESLKNTASLIGRHCNERDLNLISQLANKLIQKKKREIGYKIIVTLICIFIISLIIWMLKN